MAPETPGLTLEAFAAKYGCAVGTVRHYISRRQLGCYKVFRQVFISPEHERKFLEMHERKAAKVWAAKAVA